MFKLPNRACEFGVKVSNTDVKSSECQLLNKYESWVWSDGLILDVTCRPVLGLYHLCMWLSSVRETPFMEPTNALRGNKAISCTVSRNTKTQLCTPFLEVVTLPCDFLKMFTESWEYFGADWNVTLFQNSDDTTRWISLPQHFVKPLHTSRCISCNMNIGWLLGNTPRVKPR